MPAGTDLIYFNDPDDWDLIVNQSRTASIINENSHTPIKTFDLGVTLEVDYIAVVVGTASAKSTWFFGGDITQSYSFAKGAGNPVLGKVRPERTRLALNRLQLIETDRISLDSFRLEYTPPAWFKDCVIKVYKYTGDTENFVEDTLFDIGNAVGIDPNTPDERLDKRIDRLEELLTQLGSDLSYQIRNSSSSNNENESTANRNNDLAGGRGDNPSSSSSSDSTDIDTRNY